MFVVIDGDLAWTYRVTVYGIHRSRCDAKEYDPSVAAKLADARKEVDKTMEEKGLNRGLRQQEVERAVGEIMLSKYGIKWRGPSELNPEIQAD